MALQSGLDTVAIAAIGTYTETYGSSNPANIANLYASIGYLEDAPNISINIVAIMDYYFKRRECD